MKSNDVIYSQSLGREWVQNSGRIANNRWGNLTKKPVPITADSNRSMVDPIQNKSRMSELNSKFKNGAVGITDALPAEVLEKISNEYLVIDSYRPSLSGLSLAALKDKFGAIHVSLNPEKGPENHLYQLALLREVIFRFFGFLPHDTQMFAILGTIATADHSNAAAVNNGVLSQVKTGEGKSTLVAMLSSFYALQGYTVDIISSSHTLATRDAEKYVAFFDFINIKSGHICNDSPSSEDFIPLVLYGTNTDFEFSYLRDSISREKKRLAPMLNTTTSDQITPTQAACRPFQMCIVDEADNLMIDKSQSSAIISTSAKDQYLPIIHFIFDVVSQYVRYTKYVTTDYDLKNSVKKALSNIGGNTQLKTLLNTLSSDVFDCWLESCSRALCELKENIHYIVRDDNINNANQEIIIIEQATGEMMKGSRWSDRTHQFLELKHGIKPQDESLSIAEINHVSFYSKYFKILGLTGTIGDALERSEIKSMYNLNIFDVPPHKPSLHTRLDLKVALSTEDYYQEILNDIHLMKNKNRPSLVLLETIEQSLEFSQWLTKQNMLHQVFNAIQNTDQSFLIRQAGLPGSVTVATNMGGRGTDIKLPLLSAESQGLHVIMGYYPESSRIEDQGIGRASRQGQPGSSRVIINLVEAPIPQGLYLLSPENQQRFLTSYRENVIKNDIAKRQFAGKMSSQRYHLFDTFSSELQSWFNATDPSRLKYVEEYLFQIMQFNRNKNQDQIESISHIPLTESEIFLKKELFRIMAMGSDEKTQKQRIQLWLQNLVSATYDEILQKWAHFFSAHNAEAGTTMIPQDLPVFLMDYFKDPQEHLKKMASRLMWSGYTKQDTLMV